MLYETEYPQVYSNSNIVLDILRRPIVWFKPLLTSLGQLLLYRVKIKPFELKCASELFDKKIIKMDDGSEILIATNEPTSKPIAVVLYLHTVCGNYTQLAHIGDMLKGDNLVYITYTRSGNDSSLSFSKFNFVGRTEELEVVVRYISLRYPNIPIHAIGASAGSALLIRYLSKCNSNKLIKSAALISPGYNFMKSCENMNAISKAYLVNKMKYMVRGLDCKQELRSVRTLNDWVGFQSKLLGYDSQEEYILDCDPVHHIHNINVPTLCVSALDDSVFDGGITKEFLNLPFINRNIMLVVTKRGGHVMFEDHGHKRSWFLRVTHEWLKNRIGYK